MDPSSPAISIWILQSTGLNLNAFTEKGVGWRQWNIKGQEEYTHSLHTLFGLNHDHIKYLPVYELQLVLF